MITIPRHHIDDFLDEIADARLRPLHKRFKIPPHVKNIDAGDTLYIVYDGQVKGEMPVLENVFIEDDWHCETTNKVWFSGRYVIGDLSQYSVIKEGERVKGFQGIRVYSQINDVEN
jgi:hypothetical protein